MPAQWIENTSGLPQEGQAVEFVLDGREVAMGGIYVERTFRSHWSGYPIERVSFWRPANFDSPDSASE
ncbi:MAG TPA: hypothetical protein VLT92_01985 [Burkholderiales bacterium]|nr:hypothetical protein [Burkholderiales bacterium]